MKIENRVANEFLRRETSARTRALLTLLFIVMLALASFSTSGATHVTGTITAISTDSMTLEIAGNNSEAVTISVRPATKFVKAGDGGASITDLSVGARVDVNARSKGHKLEAVTVIIREQPAPHTDRPTRRAAPRPITA